MSTATSSTVSITLSGIGATDFTKTEVDKGIVTRSSDNGLHTLQHIGQVTKSGRKRSVVRIQLTDPADTTIVATATMTMDFPKGSSAFGVVPARALVDLLQANTWEEIDLAAAGHNLG
jgi:hypothetical protein